MEVILKFNLPEEQSEFDMATDGARTHSVLWEMDQWLRTQYKYMPDEGYSEDRYDAYYEARQKLGEIMFEYGVKLE